MEAQEKIRGKHNRGEENRYDKGSWGRLYL